MSRYLIAVTAIVCTVQSDVTAAAEFSLGKNMNIDKTKLCYALKGLTLPSHHPLRLYRL